MKGYSIKLQYINVIKQVFFQTEENAENEKKWIEACNLLEKIGDESRSAPEFFKNAIEMFEQYGFVQVKK